LKTITKSNVEDYEIIIVDDCSKEEERVECLVNEFKNIKFNIIRLEKNKRWYCNPCIPYNIGFRQIKGEIVITHGSNTSKLLYICIPFNPSFLYLSIKILVSKGVIFII
jgi:hypothetical protein